MVKIEVILAENRGMCYGVRGAVKIAEETAKLHSGNDSICTLGPLVHNPHVTDYFAEKGVRIADSLNEIGRGTVIIRAHGVPESVKKKAAKKGLDVIDATCPGVLKLRDAALKLESEDHFVLVYGKEEHPEIVGITGNMKDYVVVRNLQEVGYVLAHHRYLGWPHKIGIVSQTTNMPEKYAEIKEEIKKQCYDFKAEDTICLATKKRQESARETAGLVDLMLVIGDESSSNSINLFNACREANEKTFFIGCKDDLKPECLGSINRAGVTAGASTPDWIIDDVARALKKI